MACFWRLDRDRLYFGMGEPGPIPYTSIVQFCAWHGIEGDRFEEFYSAMLVLDRVRVKQLRVAMELDPVPLENLPKLTQGVFNAVFDSG